MENINTFKELEDIAIAENKKIFEIFQQLEAQMQEISVHNVREMMRENLISMYWGIRHGIESHEPSMSGLSGGDSKKIRDRYSNNPNLPMDRLFGKILNYAIAVMEENMRMGRIVACPTAGSCGIVPSVIIAYAETFEFCTERQIDALITAGGIGKIVSQKVALAGAIAGCQAECGVAGAMAAGALTELMGGNNSQILNAAALSLKNSLGLACDPVAGLVEIPCVKRNGFLAIHAVTASEMSLSGVESAIPIDEVVDAMKQIGILMSPLVKESSEGGLATTKKGREIDKKLKEMWRQSFKGSADE
jgi:L-serine dehydratase